MCNNSPSPIKKNQFTKNKLRAIKSIDIVGNPRREELTVINRGFPTMITRFEKKESSFNYIPEEILVAS